MQAGEQVFMDGMKVSVAKLAKAQSKMELELENLSKAGELLENKEEHSRAREYSARILYFVGIYTAITFYRILTRGIPNLGKVRS